MLHPQAQAFLDGLAENPAPGWNELSPDEGREGFASLTELFGQGPDLAAVENSMARGKVPIRIYRPHGDGPFPAIVYFHGGGWVLGDLDTHDALCRRLASEAESIVVSVDYRRSPETVYPGARDDCYTATEFVFRHATELQIDVSRILVAGDSAGANLAASVSQLARDSRDFTISQQVLIYPVLDHRCCTESYEEFAEGFGLTRTAMRWFWDQYAAAETKREDGLVSPLLADDLRGLPPTHIVTAEYDVLRDEGEQYADRLRQAGVPTTHQRYDGMIHGFIHFSGLFDTGSQAIREIAQVIHSPPL